jgi:hypothetical protein
MTLTRHPQIWLRCWRLLESGESSLRVVALLFLHLGFRPLLSFWHYEHCHETERTKFKNQKHYQFLWKKGIAGVPAVTNRLTTARDYGL